MANFLVTAFSIFMGGLFFWIGFYFWNKADSRIPAMPFPVGTWLAAGIIVLVSAQLSLHGLALT